MDNQKLAFEKLNKLKCGALFMEMGTGKTKVALDLMAHRSHKTNYNLWICPYSVKKEIEIERLKWHPELQLDIIGCESIGQSDRIYAETISRCKGTVFVVVDESLKIKNREAKRTQRILEIGKRSEYRLILNGTPLSKNVLDLWTQMEFLSPKILGMSYTQFKNSYCEYYIRGNLKGRVKKQHNIENLVSKIRPYIFDCELDISPGKEYHDCSYYMNKDVLCEYNDIKREFLLKISDINNSVDFYSLATRLQMCFVKAKKDELDLILRKPEKTIVFVKFLESIPHDALKISGAMSEAERRKAITEFKSGNRPLFITYGCGAYGLNLQFCSRIVFAEHSFDYAQRLQAEARIYRIGQARDVHYYSLWCDCGLEKLIKASLEKKTDLLSEVKKEIESKGVKQWLKSI